MEKIIELESLCEVGKGNAKITDTHIDVEISGIIGGMKVWLIGGEEAEKVGNIVNGRLARDIDTTRHTGVLVTQSGRQLFIGQYGEKKEIKEVRPPVEEFIEIDGVRLKKIKDKNYGSFCDELKYLLSNRRVYQNYKKYGFYCAAENQEWGALALKYEENEENPLEYFGDMCICKDGYIMVCVDKRTKKIKKLI